jgi:hypothetical protein
VVACQRQTVRYSLRSQPSKARNFGIARLFGAALLGVALIVLLLNLHRRLRADVERTYAIKLKGESDLRYVSGRVALLVERGPFIVVAATAAGGLLLLIGSRIRPKVVQLGALHRTPTASSFL